MVFQALHPADNNDRATISPGRLSSFKLTFFSYAIFVLHNDVDLRIGLKGGSLLCQCSISFTITLDKRIRALHLIKIINITVKTILTQSDCF